jgi:predicted acylesterase/phospholipase RssA
MKTIHFILPGGGLRGSFQAGFLYKLFKDYKNFFKIYKIDGTSVGAINGITIICNKLELLKNTWVKIKNINDFFSNWSNTPIIGGIYNIYYGFYNNGLYNNQLLLDKLTKNLDIENCVNLNKFSCAVTNVDKANVEYKLGTNKDIIKYVVASASPWIICNPYLINKTCYTDGCVLETYPIKYVSNSKADIIAIIGFDQEMINFEKPDCKNILHFMATLLDIARYNSINSKNLIDLIKNGNCIPITNPMKIVFDKFDHKDIVKGFNQGEEAAEHFFNTYLK